MAISDTKLRTYHVKPYWGLQVVADADGLSVNISPKGGASCNTGGNGM